jgi:hypothetical protein
MEGGVSDLFDLVRAQHLSMLRVLRLAMLFSSLCMYICVYIHIVCICIYLYVYI